MTRTLAGPAPVPTRAPVSARAATATPAATARALPGARGQAVPVDATDDRGSVTVFVAIAVLGLLALAGLVVDGGAKVRAVQHADRVAGEAARAAGQAVDLAAVLAGDTIRVDRRAALAAAEAYLRSAGVVGSARLTDGGSGVAVETTTTASTVFLGLIGVDTFTVHGAADVALVHGTRGVRP